MELNGWQYEIQNRYLGKCRFFVAGFWAIYFAMVSKDLAIDPIVRALARFSCPLALAGDYFHFPVGIYSVFLTNAASHTLVGLTVETVRRQLNHAR
jgi:hypothetical protein